MEGGRDDEPMRSSMGQGHPGRPAPTGARARRLPQNALPLWLSLDLIERHCSKSAARKLKRTGYCRRKIPIVIPDGPQRRSGAHSHNPYPSWHRQPLWIPACAGMTASR